MNAANLKRLAGERFVQLLLGRSKDDNRTHDQLRREAAKQILLEERRRQGSTGKFPSTPGTGFENLFQRIWKIVQTMNHFADIERRRAVTTVEPSPTTAPIVCSDEPVQGVNNTLKDNAVTLPVFSSGTGKQLIPDHEFPRIGGMADEVTQAWRQSCERNNQIRAERDRRSAQRRSQQTNTYVG
jgi:hypothetical protein